MNPREQKLASALAVFLTAALPAAAGAIAFRAQPVLLKMHMGAGHGGASGRFNRLDEVAIVYAFALWATGLADSAEV